MESSHQGLVRMGAALGEIPQSLKPGMSHSIQAGEKLTIRDTNGDEISIEAKEHDATMVFLNAYDELLLARRDGLTGAGMQAIENAVEATFHRLPGHVVRELTSFRRLASRV